MKATAHKQAARCVLTLLLSGCIGLDLGDSLAAPVACGAEASARGFGEAIGNALKAPSPQALRDDSGDLLPAVEGTCVGDDCNPRIAQVGTVIDVQVDVAALAATREISLDATPAALVSTDAKLIRVFNGTAHHDACSDRSVIRAQVKFTEEGRAALRVEHGADELARFGFEVAQAERLEVTAFAGPTSSSLQISGTETGTHGVRGGLNAGVSLNVRARAADGRVMLLDNSVRSTIDNASVAQFLRSEEPDETHGVELYVVLSKPGTTTLRTEAGQLTTLIELQADPSLPSPPPITAGVGGSVR